MPLRTNFAAGQSDRCQPEASGSPRASGRGAGVIAHVGEHESPSWWPRGDRGQSRVSRSGPGWWRGWGTDLEEIALVDLVKWGHFISAHGVDPGEGEQGYRLRETTLQDQDNKTQPQVNCDESWGDGAGPIALGRAVQGLGTPLPVGVWWDRGDGVLLEGRTEDPAALLVSVSAAEDAAPLRGQQRQEPRAPFGPRLFSQGCVLCFKSPPWLHSSNSSLV